MSNSLLTLCVLDKLREEGGTLPDDSGGPGFLLLTPAEVQPVVHLTLLMQHRLLLLHLAHTLLLCLIRLEITYKLSRGAQI